MDEQVEPNCYKMADKLGRPFDRLTTRPIDHSGN